MTKAQRIIATPSFDGEFDICQLKGWPNKLFLLPALMNTKPFLNIFLTMGLIIGFASCKKDSSNPPLWFTTHSRFYYDVSTDTSVLPSHLLDVGPGFTANELFFYETAVDTSITSYSQYFQIFGNGLLKPREDGLYSTASSSCGFGPSLSSFDYLNIPADAKTGASITQYRCGHNIAGDNRILNEDTIISVPAGTYHTFCILHPNSDRSYWNRETGIIMYEEYQHDATLPFVKLLTLKLRRMD